MSFLPTSYHAPEQLRNELGVVREVCVHQNHPICPRQSKSVNVCATKAKLTRSLMDLDDLWTIQFLCAKTMRVE